VADLIPELVNRAHNDALETIFEGGALSLLLLLGFLGWLGRATYQAFVRQDVIEGRQARSGAIAMWLLLVHSLWDYPLRTVALETIFGFCVALQFAPPRARTSLLVSFGRDADGTRRVPKRAGRSFHDALMPGRFQQFFNTARRLSGATKLPVLVRPVLGAAVKPPRFRLRA
jgi:hypothetical protein